MPRTRKPKPTDAFETTLDQFAGPARPMSQGEVEAATKHFKKVLVERMRAVRSRRTPAISAMAPAARRS